MITSRHVTFDENSFPFRSAPHTSNPPSAGPVHHPTTDNVVIQELPQPRILPPPRVQAHAVPESPTTDTAVVASTLQTPSLTHPLLRHSRQ